MQRAFYVFRDIDGTSRSSEIIYSPPAHIHILAQTSEPLLSCLVLPAPPPHCALSSPRSTVYLQCSIRGTLRFPARVWLAEGSTFCERLVLRRLSLASVLHIRSIAP